MINNSTFGFMFQEEICKFFNLVPLSKKLRKIFESNHEDLLEEYLKENIKLIFSEINIKPVVCTTFLKDGEEILPYNFVLSDNRTLSLRTNINNDKISPRIIGQAGYKTLNKYFKPIYGKEIKNQNDIKNLFLTKIEEVFDVFFNALFDADLILWIYGKHDKFNYKILYKNNYNYIKFKKELFTFTKDSLSWNESNTIKYNGISVAEVQVHKNRNFKFRFIMKNLISIINS